MKKYRTNAYSGDIEVVDVVRETDSYIFFKKAGSERREKKVGNTWHYFDTKEEAINFRHDELMEVVHAAERQLAYHRGKLDSFKEKHGL